MYVGRAMLFVPGDRPDRIVKALGTAADSVAVDFEDAVADAHKATARARTAEVLDGLPERPGPAVYVRVNALGHPESQADLDAVARLSGRGRVDGVILPKAESAAQIEEVDRALSAAGGAAEAEGGLPLVPIVETARGVLAAAALASAAPRVQALMFGTLDLAHELGVEPSVEGHELLHARSQVVLASRAAGLAGPLDGPYQALDDEEGLVRSSAAARRLGFTGRVVLHPRQVGPVRDAFAPAPHELDRAREVLAAYEAAQERGAGALRLADGTFVDRPVVARAVALLGAAQSGKGAENGPPASGVRGAEAAR
ncbi:malyl-CoA lyase [Streptomyces daqingensis]|uniref:Malyl-CoA lyase n=1 Tax=Streptomyces daqingensis TaxID=1472640 RepID=A0ABQ2LQ10_9ACTN|nr:CoA ester lyase [Streptomyces daqingensis]GGO41704.1 malyl-CoA lyase [Streptomyces daqingensis]